MAKLSIRDQVSKRTGTEDSRDVSLHIKDIPIGEISIRENIRKDYDGIDELKISIKEYGLLQPITIYRDGEGYAVKTGHRRYLAYKELYREYPDKFHSIRCIISDNENIKVIQLIENVQRSDLNHKDLYDTLVSLRAEGYSHNQIAELMGKNESYVKYIFTGINEIKGNADLENYLEGSGGTIQDIIETKGIPDKTERLNLLEQRKEGNISRAEMRKQVKGLKGKDKGYAGITNTKKEKNTYKASVSCNEKKHTITISLYEMDAPVKQIAEDLKKILPKIRLLPD